MPALEAARDPVRAASVSAYMRHQFTYFGVTMPRLQALLRELPQPEPGQVIELALACWELPEREYQYAALWYLRKAARQLPSECLPALERLIISKPWWDTVDGLATQVVGTLVLSHPELGAVMDRWVEADNLWLVRTAILHQERWKEQTDAARLFGYCVRRAGDRDFFIRKAIGWALRSYAATDPAAVARFVHENTALLSGLSKREALKGVERHLR